jgi:Protein of unknown function (DUF1538)
MNLLQDIIDTGLATLTDILPIAVIIFGFRLLVLRQPIAGLGRILAGFAYVLVGLTLFLVGLQEALFPVGRAMAQQLTAHAIAGGGTLHGRTTYLWIYLFAAAIGFSTTIAEPALIAVAIKARQVSAGAIDAWGLRIAVAIGVALGITLGVFRIITGTPLHWYIIAGYTIVIIQSMFAPRTIIALAYDSGGVTTSTVTVPLVTALGLGLAGSIPGRSPLLDGFGLVAFASLFPIMSVMAYAQLGSWWVRRGQFNHDEQT